MYRPNTNINGFFYRLKTRIQQVDTCSAHDQKSPVNFVQHELAESWPIGELKTL